MNIAKELFKIKRTPIQEVYVIIGFTLYALRFIRGTNPMREENME
jgi:hypothetical protein